MPRLVRFVYTTQLWASGIVGRMIYLVRLFLLGLTSSDAVSKRSCIGRVNQQRIEGVATGAAHGDHPNPISFQRLSLGLQAHMLRIPF